jgi:hypothetical protein
MIGLIINIVLFLSYIMVYDVRMKEGKNQKGSMGPVHGIRL